MVLLNVQTSFINDLSQCEEKCFLLESRLNSDTNHSYLLKDSVAQSLVDSGSGSLDRVSGEGSGVGFMEGMKFH